MRAQSVPPCVNVSPRAHVGLRCSSPIITSSEVVIFVLNRLITEKFLEKQRFQTVNIRHFVIFQHWFWPSSQLQRPQSHSQWPYDRPQVSGRISRYYKRISNIWGIWFGLPALMVSGNPIWIQPMTKKICCQNEQKQVEKQLPLIWHRARISIEIKETHFIRTLDRTC